MSIRTPTKDDLLSTQPDRKILALNRVWVGSLQPLLDETIEVLGPLEGFTLGRNVQAEVSHAALNLGKVWVGQLRNEIAAAATSDDYRGPETPDTDVSELYTAARLLHAQMSTVPPDFPATSAAITRLREARDALKVQRRTGDSGRGLMARRTIGTFGKALTPAELNKRHAAHWADKTGLAAPTATPAKSAGPRTPREINEMNRAFWANRDLPSGGRPR